MSVIWVLLYMAMMIYPLLCPLLHTIFTLFLVSLLVAFLPLAFLTIALPLPIPAIGQAAEKFARLRRNTVYSTGVNLDTPIESTASLLEVDAIPLFQQRHVVEVVDEGKVPRVGRVDFLLVISR